MSLPELQGTPGPRPWNERQAPAGDTGGPPRPGEKGPFRQEGRPRKLGSQKKTCPDACSVLAEDSSAQREKPKRVRKGSRGGKGWCPASAHRRAHRAKARCFLEETRASPAPETAASLLTPKLLQTAHLTRTTTHIPKRFKGPSLLQETLKPSLNRPNSDVP